MLAAYRSNWAGLRNRIAKITDFNQVELIVIRDVVNGLILTKEEYPDILQSYARLKDTDLPNTIQSLNGYLIERALKNAYRFCKMGR